jgi:hypothetical protein
MEECITNLALLKTLQIIIIIIIIIIILYA